MDVDGKVIQVVGERSGVSKAGNNWKAREYVLETKDNFPKKIHFDFFGDKADQYPLNVGDEIKLYFDIESREYQGRWYTSIRGWKAESLANVAPAQGPDPMGTGWGNAPVPPPPSMAQQQPISPAPGNSEDLPF